MCILHVTYYIYYIITYTENGNVKFTNRDRDGGHNKTKRKGC